MQYEPTREEKIQSFKDKKELENKIKASFVLIISESHRTSNKSRMKTLEEKFSFLTLRQKSLRQSKTLE